MIFLYLKLKRFVKSFFVIPAKARSQYIQTVTERLDSGFHRSDDF